MNTHEHGMLDIDSNGPPENEIVKKKQKLFIITPLLIIMASFDLWQGILFFANLVQYSKGGSWSLIGLFSSILITASLLCGVFGKTWLLVKTIRQRVFEIKILDYIILSQFIIALLWAIAGSINAEQLGNTAAYRALNIPGVIMTMLLFLSLVYFVVTLSLRFILKWAGKER